MKYFILSIYLYPKYGNNVTKLTIHIGYAYLTINHVSSNSRQIWLNSQILANCIPNSRIEKIKIDGL